MEFLFGELLELVFAEGFVLFEGAVLADGGIAHEDAGVAQRSSRIAYLVGESHICLVGLQQLYSLIGFILDFVCELGQLITHKRRGATAPHLHQNLGEKFLEFCLRLPQLGSDGLQRPRLLLLLLEILKPIGSLHLPHLQTDLMIDGLRLRLSENPHPFNAGVHGGCA